MEDKYKKIFDLLYEMLNFTASSLNRKDNRIHMFFDGIGEWDVVIDPKTVVMFEDEE